MRGILVFAGFAAFCCSRTPAGTPFTLRVAVSGSLDHVGPDTEPRNWATLAQPWVFEPLARIGDRGEIQPLLAARVETLDATRLRLWLRTDARFEDGTAITFADVLASVARNHLRATEGPGEAIVIESTERGVPPELVLARTPIFRKAGGSVIGAGPFVVREQDAQHIVLQRRSPVRGRIDRVVIQSYTTPKDASAHTLKGDADLLPEAEPRWVEFFEGVPRLKVIRGPSTHVNVVAFNLGRLSRLERIALARALASDELRVQGLGESCIAPEHRVSHELLPRGRRLDVLAVPFFERFAFAIRRTLSDRGGEVRLVELQPYFETIKAGDFDLVAARPQVSPPSMAALIWRTGATGNVLGYSNPRVDSALDARDWAAAQRALDEDPPAAFICTRPNIIIVDARIRNASTTPADLPQWEIAE